ncbi:class I SAM-dependent methyltransferase [Pseudemcibacter aquimaris]|uniref:class I SAM-dependent methyltransferase n=1 Tax=Pseudemcibacter aquimaris TaxID=2857064 RepID=UPI0020116F78|nr:class I SAM-dependent methyltransferase [Pseudemcibacter aquimaris]MCC3861262.1 class I SAM-dependent methyltransferase [Pseudemcibacter aquimaris]WDU58036.1 class I SAM-dependent methyltransferase [Pseudemcibacter aquimaris]
MNRPDQKQELLDRQKEHFNSIAHEYHQARLHKNHQLLKKLIWKHCLKEISLLPKRKYNLLEAMCGFAEGNEIIPKHLGVQIVYCGFDYSDQVVSLLKEQNTDLNIWQADATSWKPEPETYDIILLIGGLHHVPDHAGQVVKSLSKGLRKGGLFINFEPTYGNPVTKKIREIIYNKNKLFDEQTERDFSVKELENLFQSADMECERIRYPGLLAYILYYNPDAFPLLNKGGEWLVRSVFWIDRLFYKNLIGRFFSFATLSIWKK